MNFSLLSFLGGAEGEVQVLKNQKIQSDFLEREVTYTLILPPFYFQKTNNSDYPILFLNDGQDIPALHLESTLNKLYAKKEIPYLIIAAPHANEDRIQEYGTASQADYKKRGSKAQNYTDFIIQEFLPYLQEHFRIKNKGYFRFFAGFSLGGLSALDIVWHYPNVFSKVGVFSGALWWRSKAYEEHYDDDNDRIIHQIIRQGHYQANLQFWFQTGTADEIEDRNNNGIIDSIDDTLDLMKELQNKGYNQDKDFEYYEIAGGEHNPATWAIALPVFLKWLFKK